jgi:hypothetical protein
MWWFNALAAYMEHTTLQAVILNLDSYNGVSQNPKLKTLGLILATYIALVCKGIFHCKYYQSNVQFTITKRQNGNTKMTE